MELMQTSDGGCSSRRVAALPRPRNAKLTVSVSGMYLSISPEDLEGGRSGVAVGAGFPPTRRPDRRGTRPATHPPVRESLAALHVSPALPAARESGSPSAAALPGFRRSGTAWRGLVSWDASIYSTLHVSPRGEAKWVRGPSGRGASRAEEKSARSTAFKVFHESRVTKHESRPFFACSGRHVVRNAG